MLNVWLCLFCNSCLLSEVSGPTMKKTKAWKKEKKKTWHRSGMWFIFLVWSFLMSPSPHQRWDMFIVSSLGPVGAALTLFCSSMEGWEGNGQWQQSDLPSHEAVLSHIFHFCVPLGPVHSEVKSNVMLLSAEYSVFNYSLHHHSRVSIATSTTNQLPIMLQSQWKYSRWKESDSDTRIKD